MEPARKETKEQLKSKGMLEYFCSACKFNFKRDKEHIVKVCPYCSAAGTVVIKGSANII